MSMLRPVFTAGVIAATALLLGGCASAPTAADGPEEGTDFLPCMVSDQGGFDDRSFNQSGFEGLTAGADEVGAEYKAVTSDDESAYAPNLQNMVDQGCDLIVTVGFTLSEATLEYAELYPDVHFAIIDDQLDTDGDGASDVANGKPIVFNTHQAAFLAGYAAASYSTTGVVGTFGGLQIPPVTIFMDGFAEGVTHFNEVNNADVRILGWDPDAQTGVFTGNFAAGTEALTAAQGLLDQDADVLFPVGGPIYKSAAEAIRESGRDVALIGVDTDLFEADPSVSDLVLTSVMKGITPATREVVLESAAGEFDSSAYVGTLENDGVAIAPFHDLADRVAPELQSELDELAAAIIDGSLVVRSPSAFN